MKNIEKEGIYVKDIEIMRIKYEEKMKEWREELMENREKEKEIYDERL